MSLLLSEYAASIGKITDKLTNVDVHSLVFIFPLTLLLLIVDTTTLNGTLSILMIAEPRFGSIVSVRLLQFENT